MKVALILEGQTEKAFLPYLRAFLRPRLPHAMPNIDPLPYDGRIPTGEKLRRVVSYLLNGRRAADQVIALTDVYTGTRPPEFRDALDAKAKMRQWVGAEPRFHPHAAQYDFEAWLLPYWPSIQRLAGHNRACPAGDPEEVNHSDPPAHRIREIFRENDLSIAVARCSELKALVNTILGLCGGEVIP